MTGLDALFEPRSIAVLGASADPSRIGGKPVANLLRFGFKGPIYPINLRQTVVQGLPAFPNIASVPGPVDLAVLAIPAAGTLEALEACAKAKVGAAIVFASGFGEVGAEGEAAQAELGALAARTGMRILGPNCLGAMNVGSGAVCTFGGAAHGGLPPMGGLSFVSQSGAFGTFTFVTAARRGLPAARWVTTGNEADIQVADCIDWMADDPATEVVMAYMEGCRDGARLIRALGRARAAGKPVVIMKVGHSSAGAAAAASHTAALAGEDAVYDAVLRQYGAHRARSVDEFLDVGYAALKGRRPAGGKLGIITMSGGAGVLMADAAGDVGLAVSPLSEATQATMRAILPYAGVQNPVDVTGQIANDKTLYPRFGTVMLEQGGFDAIAGFHAVGGLDSETGDAIADTWEGLRALFPDVPVFLSMLSTPALRARLEALRIPVFDEPGRMVHAIAALARFAPPPADAPPSPRPAVLTGEALSEAAASRILAAAGVPMLAHRIAATAAEAVAAAEALGMPVVLKIVSADIAHKTEIGGVKLNLASAEAVAQAYDAIRAGVAQHAPAARIEGVMVAPMARGGTEMIAGVQRDPVFGPVVMLGLGGVLVEVLRDVSFRHAPFSPADARAMVAELRGAAILDGVRGQKPADIAALVDALVALGRFAADNAATLAGVEINPLLVRPEGEGVIGLDALVTAA
jgi:acyl-CoA synthetase (NDP forming)